MRTAGLVASVALLAAACGSDENVGQTGVDAPEIDCKGAETLAASGSSAQANAMTRFINVYQAACENHTVNYNSSGSGAGVSDFLAAQTEFGGSDSPLDAEAGEVADARERCGGNDPWHLPAVFGPIAISYNLEGVQDGIALDGPTLGKIFSGEVTSWDDPAIAELNEGVELPDQDITVIFRSDESGTTDNFQQYLQTAAGDDWGQGAGKTFNGGVGEGAKGNEGTASAVASTPGAVSYNEWSFAQQRDLQMASVINSGGGEPVELTVESAGAAIDAAEFAGDGNDLRLDLDSIYGTETEGAYPLVLATYEIVCSTYPDTEVAEAVKTFLSVAVTDGQQNLEEHGYIPLPSKFEERMTTAVEAIS
ncbi:phosphate ABC transporter substrate-binding protein PstS [Haloechinothrix sp. YIM 98757]|uniref:Phosphate-binding protein n=2 Tax=Haloechinothrix aidingensis TaxID=2752311 RepID=A0A838A7R0_9PSEU|nr:phosphate ABC transporter substrate-binding protein PstS [Haloechinothrix aidingensis]MBA0124411.1 phosphate ABC transporter substrate-binding protein PstS [Haloechinothrix aidingensis]